MPERNRERGEHNRLGYRDADEQEDYDERGAQPDEGDPEEEPGEDDTRATPEQG